MHITETKAIRHQGYRTRWWKAGQAGAIQHALARAIDGEQEGMHSRLKEHSLLTRDSRMVERKKYGQPKARKRFQFSKR